jgi:isopentenyl-diphosphate Delta-isomerase
MIEEVVLVDENDTPVGLMEKMEAHRLGLLHRAFSVFVFNSQNELLLQQRAFTKYHSAGLWSNTCCSHPRHNEDTSAAAKRRLQEEMGMDLELNYKTNFIYKTTFDNNLTEHEFDHVYTAISNTLPAINVEEVNNYRYLGLEKLKEEIKEKPEEFTSWFKIAIEKLF